MDEKLDDLIYRIRPGVNFGRILQEVSCLQWFSSAQYLNDPFDGIAHFDSENVAELHFLTNQFDPASERTFPVRLVGDKKWMVSCYTNDWRSGPMWAHYGSGGSGYCLGYRKDTVIERVSHHQLIPALGTRDKPIYGSVKYVTELPAESEPVEIRILSKIESWRYENEWRIAALGIEQPKRKGGMLVNLHGALKHVLVGWAAGSETYTPLIDLVNKLRRRGEDVRIGIVRIDNPTRELRIDWPWDSHLDPIKK